MAEPRIMMGQTGGVRKRPPEPEIGWRVLRWVGLLFLVVGGFDVALVWFPANFGSAEFEFASVSASLNSLPVATMGMALVVVSGAMLGQHWSAWVAFVVAAVALVFVIVGAVLFALTVPLALQAPVEDAVRVGIQKQVVKGSLQVVAYGLAYAVLARQAFRVARGS
jgi:hypothetical protein